MSRHLATISKIKPKTNENKSNSLNKSVTNLDPLIDKTPINKNLSNFFSPYSKNSLIQKSLEKLSQKHLIASHKGKINPIKKKTTNHRLHSLSLIVEDSVIRTDKQKIGSKLLQKLEECYVSVDYIEVYLDVLDEIIFYNEDFGEVLKALKSQFHSIISSQQNEIQKLSKNFQHVLNLKNQLERKSEELEINYSEMKNQLEDVYEKYSDLSDKLIKISKITVESDELTEENLKKAKQEAYLYQDTYLVMKDKLKYYKSKSRKFQKILDHLESQGLNIEELYLNKIKKPKIMPKYSGKSDLPSCTEDENIVSSRVIPGKKPKKVPNLNFLNLENSSSSEENSTSS